MENGPKIGLGVATALVLAVGIRIGLIYRANHTDAPVKPDPYAKAKLTDDDMVFIRHQRPDSLKDERALIGTTIWVSAGGQLDYYPATAHHADYAHRTGTLLGATPLLIKDVFEQVPPKGRPVARIPAGEKHVLLAFTLPQSPEPTKLYATPVGYFENANYTFFSDDIFFYDDPHILYKHWGPDVWAHIEKHETFPGMSENQAMMSLGQVIIPSSNDFGNRTVTYNNNDHPIKIVFEKNKATTITPETP